MKRLAAISLAAFAFSFAAYVPAHADISDIRASDRAIELDLGAQNFNYHEDYDTDNGWGVAIGGNARYLTNENSKSWVFSNLYFAGGVQASFGDSDYSGNLPVISTGASVPTSSTTSNTIVNLGFQFGRGFGLYDQLMIIPMVDVGYRYWDRSLSGSGNGEKLDNGNVQGGVQVQWSPIPKWVFGLTGEYGTTFDSQLRNNGGKYDLDGKELYTLGGKVGYTMTKYFEITGQLQYRGFGYGASSRQSNGTFEAGSYTHETTALVGVAYHLP